MTGRQLAPSGVEIGTAPGSLLVRYAKQGKAGSTGGG